MSEENQVIEAEYCDPEFELCKQEWNDSMWDNWEYTPSDGDLAVIIQGSLGVVNVALPILLWYLYQNGGDRLVEESLFWYTWYIGWITHAALWGGIVILWPLTYLDVDVLNYTYVMLSNVIMFAGPAAYWAIIGSFLGAVITYNEYSAAVSYAEYWITLGVYALLAGGTAIGQFMMAYPLNFWYYVNPEIEAQEQEVGDETNEGELDQANLLAF